MYNHKYRPNHVQSIIDRFVRAIKIFFLFLEKIKFFFKKTLFPLSHFAVHCLVLLLPKKLNMESIVVHVS